MVVPVVLVHLARDIFGRDAEISVVDGENVVATMMPAKHNPITVWCTKTALRNHRDVLERIVRSPPTVPGVAREWTRYAYTIAIDVCGQQTPTTIERREIASRIQN